MGTSRSQCDSTRIKKSEFSIFELITNIKVRALLAVGLGCDVYIPGIKQLGRVGIKKYVDNESLLSYESILQFYYEQIEKQYASEKKKKFVK